MNSKEDVKMTRSIRQAINIAAIFVFLVSLAAIESGPVAWVGIALSEWWIVKRML